MKLFEPRVLTRNHALALLGLALLSAIAGIAFQHPAWKFATNALWIVIMVWHVICLGYDLFRTNAIRKRLEELSARTQLEYDKAMRLMAQGHQGDWYEAGQPVLTVDECRERAHAHLKEAERLLDMRQAICNGMRKALKDQLR